VSEIRSQATPARDELVHILAGALLDNPGGIGTLPQHAADRLLAAGWSKPRTVNSAAEAEALPVGTVVRELDDAPSVFEKVAHEEGETGWEMPGDLHWYTPGEITLPATVLFTPGDAG